MRCKGEGGFTLPEVVITVGILTILMSLSLPLFSHSRTDRDGKVCAVNRAAMENRMESVLLHSRGAREEETRAALEEEFSAYACPGGGTYTPKLVDGEWKVICSVHSETDPMKPIFSALADAGFVNADGTPTAAMKSAIDSTSPNGTGIAAANSHLSTSLDALGIKSWRAQKNSGYLTLMWTGADVSQLSVGDKVVIMRYNTAGSYGGLYSVWTATISQTTLDGITYPIISTNMTQVKASADLDKLDAETKQRLKSDYTYMNQIYQDAFAAQAQK